MTSASVQKALAARANAKLIPQFLRFFKSGVGGYGEGDQFIGVRVPDSRLIAKRFLGLPLREVDRLLDSSIHEHRQVALFILVYRYLAASRPSSRDEAVREELTLFYQSALRRGRVNNWDLVDSSAEHLLGNFLLHRSREVLFDLSSSSSLWQRRASIIATFAFIKARDPSTTLELAVRLLNDRENLMHKAVGWMLREVGKRIDPKILTTFLDEHAAQMPRVMLSYACEHLSPQQRTDYRSRT